MNDIDEAERFIQTLVAQPDMHTLDEALAVLSADDLHLIVRRLIIDVSPNVKRAEAAVAPRPVRWTQPLVFLDRDSRTPSHRAGQKRRSGKRDSRR